jgi:hypothetical protein
MSVRCGLQIVKSVGANDCCSDTPAAVDRLIRLSGGSGMYRQLRTFQSRAHTSGRSLRHRTSAGKRCVGAGASRGNSVVANAGMSVLLGSLSQ